MWLRAPEEVGSAPSQEAEVSSPQFVYQRIWSTDAFKVGNSLDFTELGPKLIMGVSNGDGPRTLSSTSERLFHRHGLAGARQQTNDDSVDVRKDAL